MWKRLFGNIKQLPKKVLAIIVIIILVVGFLVFRQISSSSQQPQYQTAQATKGTLINSVTASGQVSVANKVSITTAASGAVKQLFVKSGDTVNQGDKIAEITLDNSGQQRQTQAYAAYLSAQNTLNAGQAQLNTLQSNMFVANQKFVNDRGVANPSSQQVADPVYIEENDTWLAAEAAYKNQQLVISQAQAALSNASAAYSQDASIVTAPASGTVADLQIAPGMQIGSSTSTSTTTTNLQTIADIRTSGEISAVVNVAEVDVASVQVGQKATVTFDSLPNQTFTGTVIGINTIGQTTSGVTTYPATIVLDSPSDKIYANMNATANIITKVDNNVLLVPTAAIQTSSEQSYARVLQNGNITQVPVTTGDSNATQTVITSGLSEGQTVVTGVTTTGASSSSSGSSPFSGGLRFGGFGGGGGGGGIRAGGGGGGRGGQ
ncbi:MAG TPA: efflux RND transporter periplasmic adaptor subunit [Patescibacteria group bacterium]|nr:efflux RND transporter periplasmic adaptor subunit [Patescibacteria group bacterium]